jgi:nucleotide-binding universal stress UspA family protein
MISYRPSMDVATIVIIIVLGWALFGVSMALLMGRWGYKPFTWLLLALVLGPLVLPVAGNTNRLDRPRVVARPSTGRKRDGPVDVLAGIDGSTESETAVRSAIDLLGARIGRLTIATVVDFDTAAMSPESEEQRRARELVDRATEPIEPRAETIVLSGQPAEVLRKFAAVNGYELIVIGRRGRGMSTRLLGSVASELAHGGEVPTLIV